MSEDEKISIEWLEKITEINKKDGVENSCAEILLKLIKKLQKENQTLKSFVSGIFNENIEKDFIQVQKVKDKIIHYQELQDNYIKKYDEINEGLQAMINALQELIEERGKKNHGENI